MGKAGCRPRPRIQCGPSSPITQPPTCPCAQCFLISKMTYVRSHLWHPGRRSTGTSASGSPSHELLEAPLRLRLTEVTLVLITTEGPASSQHSEHTPKEDVFWKPEVNSMSFPGPRPPALVLPGGSSGGSHSNAHIRAPRKTPAAVPCDATRATPARPHGTLLRENSASRAVRTSFRTPWGC